LTARSQTEKFELWLVGAGELEPLEDQVRGKVPLGSHDLGIMAAPILYLSTPLLKSHLAKEPKII